MNLTTRAARVGLAFALAASLVATYAVPVAVGSTSVVSAGNVPAGGTSAAQATFTLTENTPSSFPPGGGTLTVTITDAGLGSTVHFTGSATFSAPGTLGASVATGAGGSSFTVTALASAPGQQEQITVGYLISADVAAIPGAIVATLSGTMAGGVIGGTVSATGTLQTAITSAGATVAVNVSSSCGFAATGGSNTVVTFGDVADARNITAATPLSVGTQTLTIDGGTNAHALGTAISQTVVDCHGATLGSPGTVGGVAIGNHLAFITQPGGGPAGAIWAQQPAVAVENSVNAVITTDNSTVVTLSIGTNPAGGTLTCSSGTSRVVVNGVATFFGCSINNASVNPYTLVATSSPVLTSATSSAFIIGTTSGNHLAFITQPGGGPAGAIWAQQPAVAVENSVNAVITTDNTTVVTLSIGTNPAGGTLTCSSGTSRVVVNGVATFFGCSINNASVNPYTLVATSSPVLTSATSSAFIIGTTGNHLAFTVQPGGGAAGAIWAQQPAVAVQNSVNAVISTDNTTVITLAIGTNPAGGTLTCSSGTSRVVVNGVATFFGCSINNASVSPYTLVATSSPVVTPATSNAFLIGGGVTSITLVDSIARGVNRGTSGFGTASLIVPANSYVTLLCVTSPALFNASVQIWTRTKTSTWVLLTARLVAADGTVHYFARVNAWRAWQCKFPGNASFSPASSHGRIATNP